MEEKDTELQEGIEVGDEPDGGKPVFSPEDEVDLAVALTNNPKAFHVLREKVMAEVRLEFEGELTALESKFDREIARLNGEHVGREPVGHPKRPLFSTRAQEMAAPATPPTNIRPPQNTPAAKSNGGSRWAQRTAAAKK